VEQTFQHFNLKIPVNDTQIYDENSTNKRFMGNSEGTNSVGNVTYKTGLLKQTGKSIIKQMKPHYLLKITLT